MNIDSDLRAAGRRAAAQPVPSPPTTATLEAGAAKHTSRRRIVLSSAAALVLVALAFPLALTMRGTTTVQTVTAGTAEAAAAQTGPPAPAAASAAQDDPGDLGDPADENPDEGVRIQLRAGDDFSLSIRVLSGDAAGVAADAAAANATETLDVDGMTVWVSGSGDQRTVAALVEPDEFVEATGSGEQLDQLIEVLRSGGLDHPGGRQGPHNDQWQDFFGQIEGGDFDQFFGPDGGFSFEGGDFDQFFGGLEEFFGPDGGFSFEGGEFPFDGDFGGLDQFFGPDGEFSFESGGLEEFFGPDSEFNFEGGEFPFDGDFGGLDQFFGPDGELLLRKWRLRPVLRRP